MKSFQDSHGNLYAKETYTYDVQGNRIKKSIAQTEDLSAYYSSCYQSDQTLLWKENPLGQRTMWFYNHHHANVPRDDKHDRPIPDANVGGRHTQLGIKDGLNGKYPQAREFDENGKAIRDIDFTEYGTRI